MNFAVLADHKVKLIESKKRHKYLDLARELKKLWILKVTVIPIVIGVRGTVTKGLVKGPENLEIRGQVETIQTWALLRLVRILRRVLETYCHSNSSGRLSSNAGVKIIMMMMMIFCFG